MKSEDINILIVARALKWFLFGPQRRKLKKAWSVYKTGGISLCWYFMKERFGSRLLYYDPFLNRLSSGQSKFILEDCPLKPLVSIVVPVYKVAGKWLEKCIGSVVNQHYANWELILVDDASQRDDLRRLIGRWVSGDKRIRSFYLEENAGIAGATNFGIKQTKGQFIGLLDHDDELTPDALTWIVWALNQNPQALWLYSDEDLITMGGKCHDPRFKPDFSPEFLLSNMFTCHFSVYSSAILAKAGGLRAGYDGSQDHDLALRLSEIVPNEKVIHIPRVLYHWREVPGSTTLGVGAKPRAPATGRRAVEEALQRRGIKGNVASYPLCSTIYQIEFVPSAYPKVSIIIPARNALPLTEKCIDSVRGHTKYPDYEIIIIDNNSDDQRFLDYIGKEESGGGIKVLHYDKPFNHSEMNNIAAEQTDSEFVVFMNNDIEILSDKWLEQLAAVMEIDKSIAAAGGLLLYPGGQVQHGGIILGCLGAAGHAHKYMHSGLPGYFGRLHTLQEMSGITAALAIVRRSSFRLVGGFDKDRYPTLYNDVDLCIRMRQKGFRCIYNPMVRAVHYETMTRPVNSDELVYKLRLAADYASALNNDPFYNRNLSLDNEQFHGYRPFPIDEQIPRLADIPKGYCD
jgi:O-antigen biosynthesis protein